VVVITYPSRFTTEEAAQITKSIKCWVGPEDDLDSPQKEKISWPCR